MHLLTALIRLWLRKLAWFVIIAIVTVLLVHLREGVIRQFIGPPPTTFTGRGVPVTSQKYTARFSWAQYRTGVGGYVTFVRKLLLEPTANKEQWTFLPILKDNWRNSFSLFMLAGMAGGLLGVLIGILYIMRLRALRLLTGVVSVVGLSVPDFLLVILGQFLSVWAYRHYNLKPWPILSGPEAERGYLLPVMVLAIAPMGLMARLTAHTLAETLQEDYIRTARGKGVPEWRVVTGHALRNALPRILSGLPTMMAIILSSLVVVERITNWPGLTPWLITLDENTYMGDHGQVFFFTPLMVTNAAVVFVAWYMLFDALAHTLQLIVTPREREASR